MRIALFSQRLANVRQIVNAVHKENEVQNVDLQHLSAVNVGGKIRYRIFAGRFRGRRGRKLAGAEFRGRYHQNVLDVSMFVPARAAVPHLLGRAEVDLVIPRLQKLDRVFRYRTEKLRQEIGRASCRESVYTPV